MSEIKLGLNGLIAHVVANIGSGDIFANSYIISKTKRPSVFHQRENGQFLTC